MSEQNQQEAEQAPAAPTGKSFFTRSRLVAAGIGLGGMILGSIVGIGVQKGVESTGLLGPSVESLIAEQQANFTNITERLDALKNLSTDKEVKSSLAELGKMLARQDELAMQANAELAYLTGQVSSMRQQQLAESGFSGGAIPVPGDSQACTIFYKQATPRADGRIGFDLTCS